MATDCGSHTNTLVPDLAHDRLLLYVSSYALAIQPDLAPGCVNPHGHISVIEVPLDDPAAASVIAEPHLFDTPVWKVWPGAPEEFQDTAGCHDITIYEPKHLAAAACMSEGQIWDISDPARPVTLAHVDLPEVSFWHSAAWSNDGSVVAFGDENLEPAGCTDAPLGAIWFYGVDDPAAPQLEGRFSLDRFQGSEICSAHMFNVIPGIDRDLLVSAFYCGRHERDRLHRSDPAGGGRLLRRRRSVARRRLGVVLVQRLHLGFGPPARAGRLPARPTRCGGRHRAAAPEPTNAGVARRYAAPMRQLPRLLRSRRL